MATLYVHTSVDELRTYLKQAWAEREGETKLLLCYCFWVGRKRGKEGKGSRAPCAASEASPINPFFLPSLLDRSPTPARRQKCPIVFRFDSHHPISALRLDNTFPHSTFTSHPLPFHVLLPKEWISGLSWTFAFHPPGLEKTRQQWPTANVQSSLSSASL